MGLIYIIFYLKKILNYIDVYDIIKSQHKYCDNLINDLRIKIIAPLLIAFVVLFLSLWKR